jgi:hypothetical protein
MPSCPSFPLDPAAKYRARVCALQDELRRLRGLRGAGVHEPLDSIRQNQSQPVAAGGPGGGGGGGGGERAAAVAGGGGGAGTDGQQRSAEDGGGSGEGDRAGGVWL